jgi:hypothetical protein
MILCFFVSFSSKIGFSSLLLHKEGIVAPIETGNTVMCCNFTPSSNLFHKADYRKSFSCNHTVKKGS